MRQVFAFAALMLCASQAFANVCRVVDGDPVQWVADICMFKNQTDDVTLEVVQACIANAKASAQSCEWNVVYKTEFCTLLIESGSFKGTLDQCIDDRSVHGATVGIGK